MRKLIQSLSVTHRVSMYELVHSILHSKLLSALRLPSFAGEGLPERMRSISFALLGLTAAAGLALVAIFAQPDFNLLSPAPLPDRPSIGESVAEAKRLPVDRGLASLVPVRSTHAQRSAGAAPSASPTDPSNGGELGSTAPSGVVAPVSAGITGASAGNDSGDGDNAGNGDGSGSDGGSSPAPPAAPQPAASPPSSPVSSPQPSTPAPEGTTSSPEPAPAPAPGNSSSSAAAEHASERGIEASASASPGHHDE